MIISLHIPKTAGSSFRRHLRILFDNRIVFDYQGPYQLVDTTPPTLSIRIHRLVHQVRVRRLGRTRLRRDDRCIHGHLQLSRYRTRFPEARLVTWLRDPVQRVISHYYHWQERPDMGHSTCRRLVRERLSLLDFAALPEMQNLQSRYLDGVPLDAFWFVGIQEYFDSMIQEFYRLLGEVPVEVEAVNVNRRKRGPDYEIAPDERAQLEELNALDRQLYEQALQRNQSLGLLTLTA